MIFQNDPELIPEEDFSGMADYDQTISDTFEEIYGEPSTEDALDYDDECDPSCTCNNPDWDEPYDEED